MIQKAEIRNQKLETMLSCFIFIFMISGFWILVCVSASAETITITGDACANAAAATPAPDVEYKPGGVDVNGNPVAPADVDGSNAMPWPQDISIPLQLNLQNALHLPATSLTSPEAVIGKIEYKNGQLTFNGKPISEDAQADIQAACRQSRSGAAPPPEPIITHKDLLKGD